MSQSLNIADIQAKLIANLKDLYPLAQKADEQLEILKKEKKGRFTAIFQQEAGFTTESNRFLPYLIELSDETQSLPMMESVNQLAKIQEMVKKIQMMHQVLGQFHSIKEESV